ncbi:MAG: dienelactone hydrolase family protein [Proteobacteria bacterium]|nr:dienelactone hydrolase family protein [Pseudomonadota bacterium]
MSYRYLAFLVRSLLFFFFFITTFALYQFEILSAPLQIKRKENHFSNLLLLPASGKKPDSMVVLFHGYGDNPENFLVVGVLLGQILPNTLFVAIEGPISCKNIPSGKQWLSTPKNKKPQLLKEIKNLTQSLNQYLDNLLKKYNISTEKMALVGFSQGARVALHLGLHRPKCGGIVALSGSYLNDPTEKNLFQPPVLIIHGTDDQKAPLSLARESYKNLDALKVPVTLITLAGVDHDIAPEELELTGEFLKECLSEKN